MRKNFKKRQLRRARRDGQIATISRDDLNLKETKLANKRIFLGALVLADQLICLMNRSRLLPMQNLGHSERRAITDAQERFVVAIALSIFFFWLLTDDIPNSFTGL